MDIAAYNLETMIREYEDEGLPNLKKFFPLFRDTILGLTFLHKQSIAHRDIKPENILIPDEEKCNNYVISDYGEGKNLQFECDYIYETFFQNGRFGIQGTVSYLDPLLYDLYIAAIESGETSLPNLKYDIFKADIYSLGVTLFKAATGEDTTFLNQSEDMMVIAYEKIH